MPTVDFQGHPEYLKAISELSPIRATTIARQLQISKSAISRTLTGNFRAIKPVLIEQFARMLGLEIGSDGSAQLAKRMHLWEVTTPTKRDLVMHALTTWLADTGSLKCNVVLCGDLSRDGLHFVLVSQKERFLSIKSSIDTHASILLVFHGKALNNTPTPLPMLPSMVASPIFSIDISSFEEALAKESVPGQAGSGNLAANVKPFAEDKIPGNELTTYLFRCRTTLGIDTAAVSLHSLISRMSVRGDFLSGHSDHSDDPFAFLDGAELCDFIQKQAEDAFRDRLDRARTGDSAWQILAYPPGSYSGPWVPVGAMAIGSELLPAMLHDAAKQGYLRLIRYPDLSHFVAYLPQQWSVSVAMEGGEGNYLTEISYAGMGDFSYEIAHVRFDEGSFSVWPSGDAQPTRMNYAEKLFSSDRLLDENRFRILGRVVGRLNFLNPS
jgi:hypothetical protein